jgi:uncharacterized membrane protein
MADRTLVLAIFEDEAAADNAARDLKDSGLTSTDAIGVLAVDATGKLKEEKVGARSTGKGAGVGAALFLLGPVGVGVGVIGGAAAGALHHKGLGLTDSDRERIGKELTNGKAAVGVLTPFNESSMISAKLGELGGASEGTWSRTRPFRPVSKSTRGSRRPCPGATSPRWGQDEGDVAPADRGRAETGTRCPATSRPRPQSSARPRGSPLPG